MKPDPIPTESTSHPENQLPFELERYICERATRDFPECIPRLILVAHRFRIWFEPELYRMIRVRARGRVIPPSLYLPKPANDIGVFLGDRVLDLNRIRGFGHHVHHILLQNRRSTEIASILESCPNAWNLALCSVIGSCTSLIPILGKMRLRKFSFDPSFFFEEYSTSVSIPFNQPMFLNVTHLQIMMIQNSMSLWSKWQELALLPKLTHLAIIGQVPQDITDNILEECRNLELYVLTHQYKAEMAQEMRLPEHEDRVVLLSVGYITFGGDWRRAAREEDGFWMAAQIRKEEAIRARKVGIPVLQTQ